MKICCYTCITGQYDRLKSVLGQSQSSKDYIDFICFTDQMGFNSLDWQVRPVPSELSGLSQVKQQRIVKVCPHRYLQDYDVSLWVDGSIQILGDLLEFVQEYDLEKVPLYTRVHPKRDCIYDEGLACIGCKKELRSVVEKQLERYRAEGYPKHVGMVETGLLLRKHNDVRCKLLCNAWASELLKESHRDQLSFNYVCWKQHFLPGIMKNEFRLNSSCGKFRLCRHGQ